MASVQSIYIALFGRPADPAGLAHWNTITSNGADLTKFLADIVQTDEYKARFEGKSDTEIVTAIYQALFGRDPETAGLNFFLAGLADGTYTPAKLAAAIVDGAQGTDRTSIENKEAAANLFTQSLDTDLEREAYAGDAAADAGRAYLSNVNEDPSTIPNQESVDQTIETIVNPSGGQSPDEGGGAGGAAADTTGPTFTSSSTINLPENTKDAITATATDPSGPITFSLLGGLDAALFDINATTGELTFKVAPDFENPTDDGGNNVYDVIIGATDSAANQSAQALEITVTDLSELVVDAGGGGDHTTINAAIAAASAGDTIIVRSGTYAENVVLDKAVNLIEDTASPGAKIAPANGHAITVQTGLSGSVIIRGIDLEGTGSGNQHGLHVQKGSGLDSLLFEDATIRDFDQYGIWATDGFAAAGAAPTIDNLSILNTMFIDNGSGTSNPDSQIKLFGFSGAVRIENVAISAPGGTVNKGIEIVGGLTTNENNANLFQPTTVLPSANVTLLNVTLADGYQRNPVALSNFQDLNSLSITNLDLSGATSSWALFNLDSIGSGTIDGPSLGLVLPANYAASTKLIDLQGPNLGGQNGSPVTINGIDVSGVAGVGLFGLLRGGNEADILNGAAGADVLNGNGGADNLFGNAGTDLLIGGAAADQMNGGADADIFVVQSDGTGEADADTIADFQSGTDKIDFISSAIVPAAGNYSETTEASYADALAAANALFAGTREYVAVQVGGDTYVFADGDGDNVADGVVKLTGIDLTGIAETDLLTSFIP